MSKFKVEVSGLKNQTDEWQDIAKSLDNEMDSLNRIKNSVSISGTAGANIKRAMELSADQLKDIIKSSKDIKKVLEEVASAYDDTEKRIKGTKVSDGVGGSSPSSYYAKKDGSITYTKDGITYHADGALLTGEKDVGVDKFGAHAGVSGAVAKGQASLEGKYGAASVEGSFLSGEAEASAGIPKDFSMSDEESKVAGLSASAAVAVASAKAEGHLGTDNYNVHGNADGSVLGADASAELGVVAGDGNVGLKASVDAEAYLAKGEVSGGFTLFGIDFNVGAEGMVGVQAEASAEVGIAGFGFDLGLGPVGLDISVDWSDADFTDLIFWD